ncbi:MAG: TonB-dependent receptor plug domain-containing protein [Candidatus Binatia bacterium]
MRRLRGALLVVTILCFLTGSLRAQEIQDSNEQSSPPSPESQQQPYFSHMQPVVVTATRTETPLQETAASITVVGEDDIQRQQANTVADALRIVPGLDFTPNGSRGTTTNILIRGAESDQTLVLIDGVEVNSVTLGAYDFSNLTTENIERIEVLRGGGGTLYGSQAIGGVINVLTKKGEGAPTISLSSEGGNGATYRETLSFSGSQGIVGFSGALANIDTDGFRSFNDGHRNFTANARIDADLLSQGSLRGFFRYGDAKIGLFNNKNYLSLPDPNARQLESSILMKGEWEQTIGASFNYRIAGAYVKNNQRFFDEPDQFDPFGSGISRIPVELKMGEIQANYSWQDLSLTTAGFEFKDRAADVRSNFSGFRSDFNKGRNNFAYYLQERLRLLNERLFVTAGFRVDDNEDFGMHVTPSWSIAYLIPQTGTKLKGGFAEGFRAPNFNELFFPDFGNPNLGPETSSEWHVGFEQSAWNSRVSLETVYFSRRVKGLIEGVLVDPDNFIFLAQNKGRADVQGVEVIPVLRLSPRWNTSGYFTFLDFDTTDGRLLRRPRTHGTVQLNYQAPLLHRGDDLLNVYLSVKVVGDRNDIDPRQGRPGTNPMFARTDVAISYLLPPWRGPFPRVTIYGKIENLFDRNYQEVLGFRSPPLNYLVGIRATF